VRTKKNKLNNIFVRNVKGGKELVQNKKKHSTMKVPLQIMGILAK
jgi:hypothetical protein